MNNLKDNFYGDYIFVFFLSFLHSHLSSFSFCKWFPCYHADAAAQTPGYGVLQCA